MSILGEREDIEYRLNLLGEYMAERKIEGGVRLVGGAAISLHYNFDRAATNDLDVIGLDQNIQAAAQALADQHGWAAGWLNDAASIYLPPMYDQDWIEVGQYGSLTVRVASPGQLLAMKLWAGRGVRDDEDIEVLCHHLSIQSQDEAVNIFEQYYPGDVPKDRALETLRSLFPGS